MEIPLKCLVSTSSSLRLLITSLATRRAILGALVRHLLTEVLDVGFEATVTARPIRG
jgi:hypothetical protein